VSVDSAASTAGAARLVVAQVYGSVETVDRHGLAILAELQVAREWDLVLITLQEVPLRRDNPGAGVTARSAPWWASAASAAAGRGPRVMEASCNLVGRCFRLPVFHYSSYQFTDRHRFP
jgi:hypothetical protein